MPSNGLPYTRILAAFMLATLISTIFAIPAQAAVTGITNTGPAKVLPGAAYAYTVVVTNGPAADTNVVVTDTVAVATIVGTPSFVLSSAPGVPVPCVGPAPFVCTAPAMAAAETMTITVNVTAGVAGTTGTNDATVDSDNSALVSATQASTLVEDADLVVTKSYAGATSPGGTGTYTITVHNNGPSSATNVTLNDTAPATITFGTVTVASTPTGVNACTPAPSTTTIACVFPTIQNGQTVTLTVPATIAAGATVGSQISNTASTPATTDQVPANNTDTETFTVGAASVDLGVTLAVDPATAAPGDTVTYTVSVTNPSTTDDATGVVVTDVLPAGLTADAAPPTPSVGTVSVANNTWTWTIGTVTKAPAAPATATPIAATFTAVVDPTTTLPTITNTVTMTSTTTDPVATNNTASVDLSISADVADLNILTAVDNSKPDQGDTIQIAIQVSNAGPADATNVVIKDVLPTGLQYVSCQPEPCELTGLKQSSQLFSMPEIPAQSAGTVVLDVIVQASEGTLQNTARVVSADQADPTGANNSDALNITVGGVSGNPGGSGSGGGTGGSGGGTGGTGGGTAFTGFTAGQLMPWFMLLFSLGLVAVEWARRMRLVSPIGSTYGFDPFQS